MKQEIKPLHRNSNHRDSSSYYRETTDLALGNEGTKPVIGFKMFCKMDARSSETGDVKFLPGILQRDI